MDLEDVSVNEPTRLTSRREEEHTHHSHDNLSGNVKVLQSGCGTTYRTDPRAPPRIDFFKHPARNAPLVIGGTIEFCARYMCVSECK